MRKAFSAICDLCGSGNIRPLYNFKFSKVARCLNCNLIFTNPQTTEEEMKRIFSSKELCNKLFPELKNYDECFEKEKSSVARTYNQILKEIETYKKKGRLLDIGCGRGEFLDRARKKGWEVYGLDFSQPSAHYAKKHFGIEVLVSNFEKANFNENFFDVVTMWDYLEHTKKPSLILEKAAKSIKKDGILVVASPNLDSLLEITAKFIYRISFGKVEMPLAKQYPFTHHYHFTLETLAKYLEKCGFKIIKVIKENTHLERLNLTFLNKLVLAFIFRLSKLSARQNRMIIFAQKN